MQHSSNGNKRVTIWQRAIIAAALQARERLATTPGPNSEDARRDVRLVHIGQDLVDRLKDAGVEIPFTL